MVRPARLDEAMPSIAWDFDHLIASQPFFAPYHQSVWPSPQIDLSNGFEFYCRETKAVKREEIKSGTLRAITDRFALSLTHQIRLLCSSY